MKAPGHGDIHVLPINDLVDHDERRDCWCGPKLESVCPERCEGGCWRCDGGIIPVAVECLEAIVVVHNAADGRP